MRKPTYREAKERYQALRVSAFAAASRELVAQGFGPDLRLTGVDVRALHARRDQWITPHPSGSGGWDWEMITAEARRDPTAFTLAIWSGPTLCGLANGRMSARNASGTRAAVSLLDVESNPDRKHPLKGEIGFISVTVAEVYGRVLNARTIRILDPLPGALGVYRRLGFAVVWKGEQAVYCEREILQ